jgi:uncharacterized SAM-binding protein YcdF (DUF218 family)
MSVVQLIKAFLVPGSSEFLVITLLVGVALLYRPATAAWGRRWLLVLSITYLLLSMPVVTAWLEERLAGTAARISTPAEARGARTVVLLGNGAVSIGPGAAALHLPSTQTGHNLVEAVRLYTLLGRPRIIASGGIPPGGGNDRSEAEILRDYLLRFGVAEADIVVERDSITTYTQAVNVSRLIDRTAPIVLVTMPGHMPRARKLFEAQHVTVIPSAASLYMLRRDPPMQRLLPSRYALRASELAMYERLAWVNSWMSGQFTPQPAR